MVFSALPFVIMVQIKEKYPPAPKPDLITYNNIKSIMRGKLIFKSEECNSCHKFYKKGRNILENLRQKRSKEFIYVFIRNEDSLVKAKNPEAIALKEEYNWTNGLHNKKHLSDSQLNDLLNYISSFD